MNLQEIIHNALNNILTTANISGIWEDYEGDGSINGKLKLQIEKEKINLFAAGKI